MILFAMTNAEIIALVMVGLLLVGLIGFGLIRYTKIKMENELDEFVAEPKTVEHTNRIDDGELLELEQLEEENIPSVSETVEGNTKEHLSEIEILLEQMQSDLEKQDKESIHTFEEEQEEKSIISYQELKAMKENHHHEDEIVKYEQEQEKHSVLNEPELPHYETPEDFGTTIETPKAEPKKNFSNSDFISPVYGKMETGNLDYPKIPNFKEEFHIDHNRDEIMFDDIKVKLKDDEETNLENTFDLGPMSEEIKQNDEFLKALKEFRNNLE